MKAWGFSPDARQNRYDAALREFFSPEFLGRIDCVAKFQPLQPEQLRQIAARLLEQSTQRAKQLGLQVEVDESAIQTLVQAGCPGWRRRAWPAPGGPVYGGRTTGGPAHL